MGQESDARDAVQTAALRAFSYIDSPRGDDGKAWLLGIVRNCCLSPLRERSQHHAWRDIDEIGDHARSVVTGQTIEIASANTHTVKPWLSGKLGYSPAVIDLAELGYPLVGGRRGFIGRTAVGVLVYQYDRHEIDVYTLPSGEFRELPRKPSGEAGYNMMAWLIGDIQYVVVSDVGGERISDFSERLRQRQATTAPAD